MNFFFQMRAVPCRARHSLSEILCRAVPCRAGGTQFEVCRAVPVPKNFPGNFPSLTLSYFAQVYFDAELPSLRF